MGNVIVVLLLVLVILFAVKNSLKHFRGQGGCCGGGDSGITKEDIPVKSLEGDKLGEKVVSISGMHCDHCAYSVTKAINRIAGASAEVDWKKKRAIVSYDRKIEDDKIRGAVEGEGFKVVEIKG